MRRIDSLYLHLPRLRFVPASTMLRPTARWSEQDDACPAVRRSIRQTQQQNQIG
jgi:hypothetical protein